MSARAQFNPATFSQPSLVQALCQAPPASRQRAYDLGPTPRRSRCAPAFPDVPEGVLQAFAAAVMRLHFEPLDPADIDRAGLQGDDGVSVCDFLAEACAAEVDRLRGMRVVR